VSAHGQQHELATVMYTVTGYPAPNASAYPRYRIADIQDAIREAWTRLEGLFLRPVLEGELAIFDRIG
jgi:hypothetical protein